MEESGRKGEGPGSGDLEWEGKGGVTREKWEKKWKRKGKVRRDKEEMINEEEKRYERKMRNKE